MIKQFKKTGLIGLGFLILGQAFLANAFADVLTPAQIDCRNKLEPVSVGSDSIDPHYLSVGHFTAIMLIPSVRASNKGVYVIRGGDPDGFFFDFPSQAPERKNGFLWARLNLKLDNKTVIPAQCIWSREDESGLPSCDIRKAVKSTGKVQETLLSGHEILDDPLKTSVTQMILNRLASIKKTFAQKMNEAEKMALIQTKSKDQQTLFEEMRKRQWQVKDTFTPQTAAAIAACKSITEPEVLRAAQTAEREFDQAVKHYRPEKF